MYSQPFFVGANNERQSKDIGTLQSRVTLLEVENVLLAEQLKEARIAK